MERIYLVLVKYDELYKHPDMEWYGLLYKLSCAGVYNNEHDANEKRNNIIKEERVRKDNVKILPMITMVDYE